MSTLAISRSVSRRAPDNAIAMAAPTEKGEYDIAGAARELLEKREPAGIVGIRESAAAVLAALVGTLHLDRDLLSGLVIVVLGAGADQHQQDPPRR